MADQELQQAMNQLHSLENQLEDLEKYFELIESVGVSHVADKVTHLEAAKLYTSLGYSLDSLYCVQLRLEGTNPLSKPEVKQELDRVKLHMAEIRAAEMKQSAPKTPESNEPPRKQLRIDKTVMTNITKRIASSNDRLDTTSSSTKKDKKEKKEKKDKKQKK